MGLLTEKCQVGPQDPRTQVSIKLPYRPNLTAWPPGPNVGLGYTPTGRLQGLVVTPGNGGRPCVGGTVRGSDHGVHRPRRDRLHRYGRQRRLRHRPRRRRPGPRLPRAVPRLDPGAGLHRRSPTAPRDMPVMLVAWWNRALSGAVSRQDARRTLTAR